MIFRILHFSRKGVSDIENIILEWLYPKFIIKTLKKKKKKNLFPSGQKSPFVNSLRGILKKQKIKLGEWRFYVDMDIRYCQSHGHFTRIVTCPFLFFQDQGIHKKKKKIK
jgi:hypothetical protein